MGKNLIENAIKGIIGEIKAEMPRELYGFVDVARARYNDTNIARHGEAREGAWVGAKISENGVVKTYRMMPFVPAKSREEAQTNTDFTEAFMKLMQPDPGAAGETGLPVDCEQTRMARLDVFQSRLALINCNEEFLTRRRSMARRLLDSPSALRSVMLCGSTRTQSAEMVSRN